jgi:hypothetical protein
MFGLGHWSRDITRTCLMERPIHLNMGLFKGAPYPSILTSCARTWPNRRLGQRVRTVRGGWVVVRGLLLLGRSKFTRSEVYPRVIS